MYLYRGLNERDYNFYLNGKNIECNLSRYKGVSSFSVPVTYTYKFKKKF